MKSTLALLLGATFAQKVASHATFQALWVDGADMGAKCARLPLSNSPITNVASNDIACNAGTSPVGGKCLVKAGSTVTVEMHQQPNDRSCSSEAIGGAHYGPVMVYLSKVSNAATADGTAGGWFKIFQDSWAKNPSSSNGDGDYWGVKDLNACCGRMNVKIPSDIAAGDYLLRAEVIALHTASSSGGAQFYATCFQLSISGGGSANPATVKFPGAYKASDAGIMVDIHSKMTTYAAPGPAVYSGGTTKSAGSGCVGCESTCSPGKGASGTVSSAPAPSQTGGGGGACTAAKYAQCGGDGWTGCTVCVSGSTCSAVSPPYYSQCA